MDEQKNQNQPIPFKKTSSWRSFLGKKWAFPAIYIGAAAIILAFVMWYQGSLTDSLVTESEQTEQTAAVQQEESEPTVQEEEAVPASNATPQLGMPVAEGVSYKVGMNYYDEQASSETQAAALVKYDDSYIPHTGIDLTSTDGKAFQVTAALAGKVTKVENDPLVGNQVEIEHPNKMVTVYQSLEQVTVKPGDEVTQGQPIGTAGRNVYEKDAGIHLHFEVRVDGNNVNPEQYMKQSQTESQ
ncbi:M23 family metallopeptidase [Brevibacillus fulvus]|uniref:Stage II sporulation protein Q n=1 Tax=Brevibacillus fulvus TaxID=1125967 RepID=A0A939BRZ3_9BACL|nr:M23 family metallopeptidase [Brevibacillus fulvus]MBM7590162.1 stage II sporulation protein Q [Brevibacillus fulvus]